ncbi:MAG: hypothetical protein JST42_14120 [Bacteroidetes bacterium]|nr:hypothetical protein [Bacteroidota bacterium]
MKHAYLLNLIPMILLYSCGTLEPAMSSANLEASVNIEVECRNDPGTRSMVMGLLRRGRAKDIRDILSGNILEIKASYYLADNAPQKLEEIGDLLMVQTGVYHVGIVENHTVIKDPR